MLTALTAPAMMVILSRGELMALTGYGQPAKQLATLKARGFYRAFIGRHGVVLERAHYETVSRGFAEKVAQQGPNLAFFKKDKNDSHSK